VEHGLDERHTALLTKEPIVRRYQPQRSDLRQCSYQYAENFVTVFSHDEVVHGKASMLFKMGAWHIAEKAAHLRSLYAPHVGVAGQETALHGQRIRAVPRVAHDTSLDWHLCQYPDHEGVRLLVRDLNKLYTAEPVLGENDFNSHGFRWINCSDADANLIAFSAS